MAHVALHWVALHVLHNCWVCLVSNLQFKNGVGACRARQCDAQFAALKAGFRAGIPAPGPVDEAAAQKMLEIMARLGGEELVGKMTSLPEGVFVQPGS